MPLVPSTFLFLVEWKKSVEEHLGSTDRIGSAKERFIAAAFATHQLLRGARLTPLRRVLGFVCYVRSVRSLLVAMPFVPSSFLFLAVRPGASSSVLASAKVHFQSPFRLEAIAKRSIELDELRSEPPAESRAGSL